MAKKIPFLNIEFTLKKGFILISVILAAMYMVINSQTSVPAIQDIRNNPALFRIDDYADKVDLHTRISSLFPRGSTVADIDQFMAKAAMDKTDETFFECTHKVEYGRIAFIYNFPQKILERVQVDNWPQHREYCKPELTPVPENEQPIILPLMPLPGEDQ